MEAQKFRRSSHRSRCKAWNKYSPRASINGAKKFVGILLSLLNSLLKSQRYALPMCSLNSPWSFLPGFSVINQPLWRGHRINHCPLHCRLAIALDQFLLAHFFGCYVRRSPGVISTFPAPSNAQSPLPHHFPIPRIIIGCPDWLAVGANRLAKLA